MRKRVFIIHGWDGSPQNCWFPWLKKELEKIGYKVFIPKFPTPKNQTLDNWLDVFNKYKLNYYKGNYDSFKEAYSQN